MSTKNPEYETVYPYQAGDEQRGMSIRDYFAANAMNGLLIGMRLDDCIQTGAHSPSISKAAYTIADAMLAERRKW